MSIKTKREIKTFWMDDFESTLIIKHLSLMDKKEEKW